MGLQHRTKIFALFLLSLCILTACKRETEGPFTSPLSPFTPTAPPQPGAGKATITGRVISRSTGDPVMNVPVRLAEVYRQEEGEESEGVFALDDAFSPGALTDRYGQFVIENVEPGEYVIVVGNVSTLEYEIIPDPSGKARVWDIPADQVSDIGDLRVELEP